MARRRLTVVVVVAAALLAACRDGGHDGDDAGPVALLARVPADVAVITYVDMTQGWARLGVADGTPDERFEQLGRTADLGTFLMPPPPFGAMSALREDARREVGFDITAVERGLDVAALPRHVVVTEVAASAATITDAVEADLVWADRLATEAVDGATLSDWGDDMVLDRRGPLRPLGQGGQLLVEADGDDTTVLVRTVDGATMGDVLAIGDSLADAPWGGELSRLVAGEIVQFMVVTDAGPYDAIVAVEALEGATTRAHLLLVHAADDVAAAATDLERVRELVTSGTLRSAGRPASDVLPDATVARDGVTVLVTLDGAGRFARLPALLAVGDLLP